MYLHLHLKQCRSEVLSHATAHYKHFCLDDVKDGEVNREMSRWMIYGIHMMIICVVGIHVHVYIYIHILYSPIHICISYTHINIYTYIHGGGL